MIPVSTLYDEYIERRKFTEEKKNPVEYIVPPPSRGSEQQVKTLTQKKKWYKQRITDKSELEAEKEKESNYV